MFFSGFSDGPSYDDETSVLFVLNNKTYIAVEDPEDGYRSVLSYIKKTNEICKNKIPPHIVKCKRYEDVNSEIISFIDIINNEIVFEIGTDYNDDYYPCAILHFYPLNLSINKNKNSYVSYFRKQKLKNILK